MLSQNGQINWTLENRFREDFTEIVDTVINFHNRTLTDPFKSHLKVLHRELLASNRPTFSISREDIEQELRILWLKYEKQYYSKKEKGNHSLRDYLIQCSALGMATWYRQQGHLIDSSNELSMAYIINTIEFQLNVKFLFEGTDYWPLCNLTKFERYLLYLKYKEDKSILEISSIIQRNREFVSLSLRDTLDRLRIAFSS